LCLYIRTKAIKEEKKGERHMKKEEEEKKITISFLRKTFERAFRL
jgi:hypothetical protein